MVRGYDDRMSNVPRPLFGGTQPCDMLWWREEEFLIQVELDTDYHAIASSLREQWTVIFVAIAALHQH